jgi:tetratricopeptide (TPR) repeat protein
VNRLNFIIAALAFLFPIYTAIGHKGPDHVVRDLTERIETEGPSTRLYVARAFEHQSLRNWDAVIVDFNRALELNPSSRVALSGCAQSLIQLGDFSQAESMALRGLALDDDLSAQAPFHAILATNYSKQERWTDALESWGRALKAPQPEIDWFLGESQALKKLLRFAEEVKVLSKARQRNPSIVLHRAWIRALVDAGDYMAALDEIEAGIARSRWKSSWLLLRARIYGETQRYVEQKEDALAALNEIRSRLNPHHPDPHLVLEEAQAEAILAK